MVAVVIGVVLGILVGAFMLVTVFVFRQRSSLFDAIYCLVVLPHSVHFDISNTFVCIKL